MVQLRTEREILRFLAFVRDEGMSFLAIGKGTDLPFPNDGIQGVVMKLGSFSRTFPLQEQK